MMYKKSYGMGIPGRCCQSPAWDGRDKMCSLSTVAASVPPEPSTACSAPGTFSKITGYVDSISQDVPQPTALSVAERTQRKALCKNAGRLKKDNCLMTFPSALPKQLPSSTI